MDEEIWKAVVGYEGYYEVSSHGRVRSLDRHITKQWRDGTYTLCVLRGRIRQPARRPNGYLCTTLSREGEVKTFLTHRLVAKEFLPNPENLPQVNHIDFDPCNCSLSNLEWVTPAQNTKHSKEAGRHSPYQVVKLNQKLTSVQASEIRKQLAIKGRLQREVARDFGVSQTTVSEVCNNKTWKPTAQILPTEC